MMAALVWQGCHTLLWFMKKETMACGHSLLYVFKVRGCIYRAGWCTSCSGKRQKPSGDKCTP